MNAACTETERIGNVNDRVRITGPTYRAPFTRGAIPALGARIGNSRENPKRPVSRVVVRSRKEAPDSARHWFPNVVVRAPSSNAGHQWVRPAMFQQSRFGGDRRSLLRLRRVAAPTEHGKRTWVRVPLHGLVSVNAHIALAQKD
jgi:hypothetical protein